MHQRTLTTSMSVPKSTKRARISLKTDDQIVYLNEEEENQRKQGYVVRDSLLSDLITKRKGQAPDLNYLNYGDKTVYGQSFAYSEAMLKALGEDKKGVGTKGTLGRTSYHDGGAVSAPWAYTPKELEDPITSLYGQDFLGKQPLAPISEEEFGTAAKKIQERKKEMAKRREEALEAQAKANEEKREAERVKQFEARAKEAIVKVFSHEGCQRRCVSAPPDVEDEKLSALAYSKKSVPLLRETPPLNNPLAGGETGFSLEGDIKSMYPYQRLRLKHAKLEAARAEAGKQNLRKNGWDEATNPGGELKAPLPTDPAAGMSPDARKRIEEKMVEHKAKEKKRSEDKVKRAEYQKYLAQLEFEKEQRRLSRLAPGKGGQVTPPYALESDASTPAESAGPSTRERTGYMAPITPAYKPELPGAMPHEDRIPPPHVEPEEVKMFGAPPPWGRQTALDDKWQKVRVYKPRSKAKVYEPVQKIEVDRELRVVRDRGLMKKEKTSLLKTMDPRQVAFIKSLPKDFGKENNSSLKPKSMGVSAVKPMKPAPSIAAAYLK